MVQRKRHAVADLEAKIVHRIHGDDGLSRVELARRLNIVASTTGIYVDRLLAEGLLLEEEASARGLGRPPQILRLNPAAGRFVGVDFDARQIQAVVVNFAQQPLLEIKRNIPSPADAGIVLKLIEDVIREVIGVDSHMVKGIGLGVPGIIAPGGVSLRYNHLRDWTNVPIGSLMAEKFHVPVSVENNLRSMALAELHAAPGRGLKNLVCLGIRSGIGSGIFVNGQLLTGASNQAGEIGQWHIGPGTAGMTETIESVASLSALLKNTGCSSIDDLLARLSARDIAIVDSVKKATTVHAWIVHQLLILFDPDRLIVAGPLVESNVYRNELSSALGSLGDAISSRVQTSELGPFAAARGAAAVAFQQWSPSI